MKKMIDTIRVVIAILFLAVVVLTVVQQALQAREPLPSSGGTYYGHWLYNQGGGHNGCQSPGNDCTWG